MMKGLPAENSNLRYGIIILVLCFLVYGNSISNGYSLDDHLVNEHNPLTQKGIAGFKEIFSSWSFREKNYNYEYRPVMLCTFALEYAVHPANPHVSHFISILLFALFTFLLFNFFRKIFPAEKATMLFGGILLFIVHPIHTEVVDNIKCRDELLAGISGLLMLMQVQHFITDKKWWRPVLILLYLILGFLSKESIFTYAAIIPVLYLFDLIKKRKNIFFVFVPLLAIVVTMQLIKMGQSHLMDKAVFHREKLFYENPLYFSPFSARIPAAFGISIYYLGLLFFPANLSFYYGYNEAAITGWSDWQTYAGILFFGLVIYFIIKKFRKEPFLVFCLFILCANLVVSSNMLKPVPGIIGERFLLFGSAGFCMIIFVTIYRFFESKHWIKEKSGWMEWKFFAIAIAGCLLLVPAIFCIERNGDWKNEFTLVIHDARLHENSAKVQYMAAYQLLGRIKAQPNSPERTEWLLDAEKFSLRCIAIYPDYVEALNNLGTIYFAEKKFAESEKYYLAGLKADSSDANMLFNLATIYQLEKQTDKANHFYEAAISNDPDIPQLIPYYKQFLVKNHKQTAGIVFITKTIPKFPQNYNLLLLIIDLYNDQHDYDSALNYLDRAYKIKPSDELAKLIETLKRIKEKN